MSCSCSHSLVLFSLYSLNDQVKDVVTHFFNSHLVLMLSNDTLDLNIDFHIWLKSHNTLVTLECDDTDIFVNEFSIAKLQCLFEIDLDIKVIMSDKFDIYADEEDLLNHLLTWLSCDKFFSSLYRALLILDNSSSWKVLVKSDIEWLLSTSRSKIVMWEKIKNEDYVVNEKTKDMILLFSMKNVVAESDDIDCCIIYFRISDQLQSFVSE